MKTTTLFKLLFACFITLLIISCRSSRTHRKPVAAHRSAGHLPPGHAKKVYGLQSARAFAPGQQKKAAHHSHKKNKKKGGKRH